MLTVLDSTVIAELHSPRFGGSPDVALTLVTLFLQHTPAVLDTLQAALVKHDVLTAQILTHRLKGSSAVLGGLRLALLCDVLDAHVRTQPLRDATALMVLLRSEYEALADALIQEWEVLSRRPLELRG